MESAVLVSVPANVVADQVKCPKCGADGVVFEQASIGRFWTVQCANKHTYRCAVDLSMRPGGYGGFTRRELQLVMLLLDGMNNKSIAQTMDISEETVKRHLSNVMDKTGMSTRLELVLCALEHPERFGLDACPSCKRALTS